MSFGAEIQEIRKEKGLSLRELSEATGISRGYLSKLENDKIGTPKHENIRKLSEALNVSYTSLMVKAGHITQSDWTKASLQEGIPVNDDVVYERILSNQKHPEINLIEQLKNNKSNLTINGWGLNEVDRKQLLDIIAAIYPAYTKEKRDPK